MIRACCQEMRRYGVQEGERMTSQERTNMNDLMIALAFVAMVLSPCVVALIRLPELEDGDTQEMSEGDVLSRMR